MYDVVFGIIIGVLGMAIYMKQKENKEAKNRPRRGRPPKTDTQLGNFEDK